MPRKLRELRADLRRTGWQIARQRGSHQTWKHDLIPERRVTLAGKDSADAKPYQKQAVQEALEEVSERQKRGRP